MWQILWRYWGNLTPASFVVQKRDTPLRKALGEGSPMVGLPIRYDKGRRSYFAKRLISGFRRGITVIMESAKSHKLSMLMRSLPG